VVDFPKSGHIFEFSPILSACVCCAVVAYICRRFPGGCRLVTVSPSTTVLHEVTSHAISITLNDAHNTITSHSPKLTQVNFEGFLNAQIESRYYNYITVITHGQCHLKSTAILAARLFELLPKQVEKLKHQL